MRRNLFAKLIFIFVLLTSSLLKAQPGPYGPPSTTVTSHIGLMNELQKRGPYAQAYGPDAGGRYFVVGPNARATPHPYLHRIRHRRAR
jgi:hypothetical protein